MFADYGVTLPIAATTTTTATSTPSTTPETGGTEDLLRRLQGEIMEPALAQILRADPELAALGDDRLRELLAEVTADHLARRTA